MTAYPRDVVDRLELVFFLNFDRCVSSLVYAEKINLCDRFFMLRMEQ